MKCEECGGRCTWRGPITNPKYIECVKCGGVNTADLFPDGDTEEVSDGE